LGSQLYYLARGIDHRNVEPDREAKSIGRETTFPDDLTDPEVLETILLNLSTEVGRRLRKESLKARTVTIKVRFADFKTVTRSKSLDYYTNLDKDIFAEASRLLQELRIHRPVRLLGVTVHNLAPKDIDQSLFASTDQEQEKLSRTVDIIKERFGEKSITLARLLKTDSTQQ
jgi:DNA polymerase-4